MRETMADPSLVRHAGRFVWLELDFDNPVNQGFIARHGVAYTPTLFVIDPVDERPAATHIGGMALPELTRFLRQGERGVRDKAASPADAALARGDAMVGRGKFGDAATAYREALRAAGPGWADRPRAVRALTWALMTGGEVRACAETAAAEAPGLPREETFPSVVLSGMSCTNQGGSAPWADSARRVLEPLAAEASALPMALRDERFQLYQQLMVAAQGRDDKVALARWGERWLGEIESTDPASDDERSALDIARVDAASLLDRPERALPALAASERAMPENYNASLRLAQMASAAKRYDDAIAACDRGLAHATGPIARCWILQVKAGALVGKGDRAGARRVLDDALAVARTIGTASNRESNVRNITRAIEEVGPRVD